MPSKPKRPCNQVGCSELTNESYCKDHKQERYGYDRYRGTAAERGYNWKWRLARRNHLMINPVCAKCGRVANVVDHVIPHKGDKKLFWDQRNWQSLCEPCHNTKTAKHDMGSW